LCGGVFEKPTEFVLGSEVRELAERKKEKY
jgi:hypothetical protein